MGKHHHARRQRARALSLRSFAGHSPHRPAARLPRASSPRRWPAGTTANSGAAAERLKVALRKILAVRRAQT